MSKGKSAAQASHASVASAVKSLRNTPLVFNKWWNEGQKKIVLAADSESHLDEIEARVRRTGAIVVKINDAGRTQLPPNTATALGIGPHAQMKVDQITSELKLY